MKVEFTAPEFDGGTDRTDHLVRWCTVESWEQAEQVAKLSGWRLCGKLPQGFTANDPLPTKEKPVLIESTPETYTKELDKAAIAFAINQMCSHYDGSEQDAYASINNAKEWDEVNATAWLLYEDYDLDVFAERLEALVIGYKESVTDLLRSLGGNIN